MNRKLTIDEQLQNIEHNQKVILKSLEQIKKHLWHDKDGEHGLKEPSDKNYPDGTGDKADYEKQQAVNYINNVVVPELEIYKAEQGNFAAQGLAEWAVAQLAQPIFNWLKTQALEYIGEALIELRKKAIPLAVEAADWLLDKLENIIVEQYGKSEQSDQDAFREAIQEKFPNSRLLNKLN